MSLRVTVLGCGTSSGVPFVGCDDPACDLSDPRNHRRRCAVYLEWDGLRLLIDTGPDIRMQCLDAGVRELDALIYTHAHADHVHGIDDMRAINNLMGRAIPTYAHQSVFDRIRTRFDYAFKDGRNAYGFWRPALEPHPFEGPFTIRDKTIRPFRQTHGRGESWGFRFGPFGYSSDADGLPEEAFDVLDGVELWIVDALRERPHPSHAHLERTLGWIERVRPRQAYLTHMNHEVDYRTWCDRLPDGIAPAYDGLVIEL